MRVQILGGTLVSLIGCGEWSRAKWPSRRIHIRRATLQSKRRLAHQLMNMGMTRCRYWSESGALKTPAREGPLV